MKTLTAFTGIVLATGAFGCAGKTFARLGPPVTADGLSVTLSDEECALDQDPEPNGSYILDLAFTMRINNGAATPASLHVERTRVVRAGHEVATDEPKETITIGAGGHRDVHVHFVEKGRDVACNNVMGLALDKAFELGSKPVPLSTLSFQPSTSPDS